VKRSAEISEAAGRTLIVTGGSRGIGAAVAQQAAAAGFAVAVNYTQNEVAAERVVHGIRSAGGVAHIFRADIGVEADIVALFEAAEATLGPIVGLVNNAGITGKLTRVVALDAADLARVMNVNVTGAFLCAREAVKRMSTKHGGAGGAIVNISSIAARIGGAGEWVHYAASKGAIETLTLGLAREVAAEGIRVNAVAPGLIETEIHAAAGDPGRLERMAGGVPMARAGTAEEVAAAVLWLLSPAASYITGTVVDVGGGR